MELGLPSLFKVEYAYDMNKPLLAAIAGVTFGMTLCVSIYHVAQVRRLRGYAERPHCQRAMHQRTLAAPIVEPAPAPALRGPGLGNCPSANRVPLTSPIVADRVLATAQMAYLNGHYDCAIALARNTVTAQPVRSYRIIGSAACGMGDLATAGDAYRHLDASSRQYQTFVCQRLGITFAHNRFVRSE